MNETAKYCDACGCSMQYTTIKGYKINMIALEFSLSMDTHIAKQVFGPYKHKTYRFCYQCVLGKLGVEP